MLWSGLSSRNSGRAWPATRGRDKASPGGDQAQLAPAPFSRRQYPHELLRHLFQLHWIAIGALHHAACRAFGSRIERKEPAETRVFWHFLAQILARSDSYAIKMS